MTPAPGGVVRCLIHVSSQAPTGPLLGTCFHPLWCERLDEGTEEGKHWWLCCHFSEILFIMHQKSFHRNWAESESYVTFHYKLNPHSDSFYSCNSDCNPDFKWSDLTSVTALQFSSSNTHHYASILIGYGTRGHPGHNTTTTKQPHPKAYPASSSSSILLQMGKSCWKKTWN